MTQPQPESKTFTVVMQPVGRRVKVEAGTSLLEAAQAAGVGLTSLCGGEGWCTGCLIRLADGTLSAPTLAEQEALTEKELAAGYRLACQALPQSNVRIDIPPESLTAPQRLQVEGRGAVAELDPPVRAVDVRLPPPDLHDLRSDATRLADALAAEGYGPATFRLPVLRDISSRLRKQDWSARLALYGGEVMAVLPPESRLFGLAVDIGTTKLAAYLLDMTTGETAAQTGAMNPQIAYGEDVISRIAYANQHDDGRHTLQARLVETLNGMVADLCIEAGASREQVVHAVVVGNTAMHHLFAGLPVRQLALSPYVPAASEALDLPAHEIGLELAPGATVHLLPNIAGYVGADHVAVILSSGIWQTKQVSLAVDIGTNTEITLAAGGRLLSCSCASGPAFEGAHIHDGMRAAPGAIEKVKIVGGEVHTYTIGGQPPVGMCGSGILDAIAEMRTAGILNERGALQTDHPLVESSDQGASFMLAPAARSGHGHDITLSRKDVNEIQLAKAAIRAGIEILITEAGITPDDIEDFIVAGAFGTYIDLASAVRVGMFPDLPLERFRQVGNAAGLGARQALVSAGLRRTAAEIARRVEYVELTIHPTFQDIFLKQMYL